MTESGEYRTLTEIKIGARRRHDLGDLNGLAQSIQARGLLHPIVIHPDNTLIVGYRRLKAVEQLGWDRIPVTVIDVDDLLLAEQDENTQRKDFTPSEAVAIGRLIAHRERELAKEREIAGKGVGDSGGRGHKKPSDNLSQGLGRTRDRVGRAVGLSGTNYQRAERVVAAAEQDVARFGDLVTQMDETGKIQPAAEELRRRTSNGKDPRRGRAIRRTTRPDSGALAALKGTCDGFVALDFSALTEMRRKEIVRVLTETIRKLNRLRKRLQQGD